MLRSRKIESLSSVCVWVPKEIVLYLPLRIKIWRAQLSTNILFHEGVLPPFCCWDRILPCHQNGFYLLMEWNSNPSTGGGPDDTPTISLRAQWIWDMDQGNWATCNPWDVVRGQDSSKTIEISATGGGNINQTTIRHHLKLVRRAKKQ